MPIKNFILKNSSKYPLKWCFLFVENNTKKKFKKNVHMEQYDVLPIFGKFKRLGLLMLPFSLFDHQDAIGVVAPVSNEHCSGFATCLHLQKAQNRPVQSPKFFFFFLFYFILFTFIFFFR